MTVTKYCIDNDNDFWWKIDNDTNRLICANSEGGAMLLAAQFYGVDADYVIANYGPIKEI